MFERLKRFIDLLSTKENDKSPASVGDPGWRFIIGKEKVNNDSEIPGIIFLTFLTLIESIQLLIVVVFVFSFIPIKPNAVFYTIYPHIRDNLHPERDLSFYQFFILTSLALLAVGLYFFRNHLRDKEFQQQLRELTLAETFWLGLQIFAVFKLVIYEKEIWARYFFYAALGLSLSAKFFWPELKRLGRYVYANIIHGDVLENRLFLWDSIFPMGLIVLICPDLDAVVARIFNWDHFYHFDSFVMAPGWAYLSGNILNMDVSTQYGALLPMVISQLTKLLGGFSYAHVVAIIVWTTIIYFLMCYAFLRFWFKSRIIASAGVLLAIKLQMFQLGGAPLIWIYPSATMIRSFFDLVFLFLILKHCRESKPKFLWGAAFCCGLSLALMLDTGIYQTLSFYAYITFLLLSSHQRSTIFSSFKDIWIILRYLLTPLVVFFGLLFLFQGPVILKPVYWTNTLEFINLFLHGWGALPVYFGLHDRHFFAFFMGFIIAVIYVWTMIVVAGLCYLKKIEWRNAFVVVLCVYGLGLYHYFIYRSAVTSYYTVGVPFVLVLCFWLDKVVQCFEKKIRKNVLLAILGIVGVALLTNNFFIYYPNVLNIGRFDWKPEKEFYKEQFVFKKDTALIDRLTTVNDRVAVLSSFETKILIDAKRKPFFFYFPLFESRHMKSDQFGGTYIFTIDRMKKILKQFEDASPEYVFVEKKLFRHQIPDAYYQHHDTLTILLEYLNAHYDADEEGEYLVALKRKVEKKP